MRHIKQISLHTGLIATLMLSSSLCYSQMYKWVDKDGNVNYSETPPPGDIEVKTIKAPPKIDSSVADKTFKDQKKYLDKASKKRSKTAEKESLAAEELAKGNKNCENARNRLASYATRPRVRQLMEDGSRVVLAEEERQKQIKIAQDLVKEFCK